MELSPFPYQGPLEPGQVHARDDLLTDLIERMTEHRVTALLGPRRYGKTSILRKMAASLIHSGTTLVWVDLFELSSMADLASRFDHGLSNVPGQAGRQLRKLAASYDINLGLVRLQLRDATANNDPALLMHDLLNSLTQTATQVPITLVVDEFAGINNVKGGAGLLRTHLQPHYQTLGIVFAGSEPSMMRTLFSDHQQPFYSQADLVEIQPLTVSETVAIIADGFASTGRGPGPLASLISNFAAGHPQRTMQLADAAWRLTERGADATADVWETARDNVRSASANGLERLYSVMTKGEKGVLRVAASNGFIFGQDGRLLDLSPGSAQHARDTLVDNGQLLRNGRKLQIVDPIFADWVRNRFPL